LDALKFTKEKRGQKFLRPRICRYPKPIPTAYDDRLHDHRSIGC